MPYVGKCEYEYECAHPDCQEALVTGLYADPPSAPWECDGERDEWYCCHLHRLQPRVMVAQSELEDAKYELDRE